MRNYLLSKYEDRYICGQVLKDILSNQVLSKSIDEVLQTRYNVHDCNDMSAFFKIVLFGHTSMKIAPFHSNLMDKTRYLIPNELLIYSYDNNSKANVLICLDSTEIYSIENYELVIKPYDISYIINHGRNNDIRKRIFVYGSTMKLDYHSIEDYLSIFHILRLIMDDSDYDQYSNMLLIALEKSIIVHSKYNNIELLIELVSINTAKRGCISKFRQVSHKFLATDYERKLTTPKTSYDRAIGLINLVKGVISNGNIHYLHFLSNYLFLDKVHGFENMMIIIICIGKLSNKFDDISKKLFQEVYHSNKHNTDPFYHLLDSLVLYRNKSVSGHIYNGNYYLEITDLELVIIIFYCVKSCYNNINIFDIIASNYIKCEDACLEYVDIFFPLAMPKSTIVQRTINMIDYNIVFGIDQIAVHHYSNYKNIINFTIYLMTSYFASFSKCSLYVSINVPIFKYDKKVIIHYFNILETFVNEKIDTNMIDTMKLFISKRLTSRFSDFGCLKYMYKYGSFHPTKSESILAKISRNKLLHPLRIWIDILVKKINTEDLELDKLQSMITDFDDLDDYELELFRYISETHLKYYDMVNTNIDYPFLYFHNRFDVEICEYILSMHLIHIYDINLLCDDLDIYKSIVLYLDALNASDINFMLLVDILYDIYSYDDFMAMSLIMAQILCNKFQWSYISGMTYIIDNSIYRIYGCNNTTKYIFFIRSYISKILEIVLESPEIYFTTEIKIIEFMIFLDSIVSIHLVHTRYISELINNLSEIFYAKLNNIPRLKILTCITDVLLYTTSIPTDRVLSSFIFDYLINLIDDKDDMRRSCENILAFSVFDLHDEIINTNTFNEYENIIEYISSLQNIDGYDLSQHIILYNFHKYNMLDISEILSNFEDSNDHIKILDFIVQYYDATGNYYINLFPHTISNRNLWEFMATYLYSINFGEFRQDQPLEYHLSYMI